MNRNFFTIAKPFFKSWLKNMLKVKTNTKHIAASLGIGVSYILTSYLNNIYDVPIGETLFPLATIIFSLVFTYVIFLGLTKNHLAAGFFNILLAIFLIKFESLFAKIVPFLKNIYHSATPYDVTYVLIVVFVLFVGVLLFYYRFNKMFNNKYVVKTYMVITLAIVIYTGIFLLQIVFIQISEAKIFSRTQNSNIGKVFDTKERPDIYFFVFDRYANNETLKKFYSYDNQPFLDEMKSIGFKENGVKFSNYQYTATSISSMLNGEYLNDLTSELPPKYSELLYSKFIEDASYPKLLKENGYDIYHSGSWWGTTRTNPNAQFNFVDTYQASVFGRKYTTTDYQDTILEGTIFKRLFASNVPLLRSIVHYEKSDQRSIVKYQLRSAKSTVEQANKKDVFGFFHILSPHPQYVFDEDGDVPEYHPDISVKDVPESVKYVNQLKYINAQILNLMKYIISESEEPPIIIIQSDEGPYHYSCEGFEDCNIYETEKERWRWKFSVLSMIYNPYSNQEYSESPVNILPSLTNELFQTKIPLKEHKNYIFDFSKPYEFIDYTSVLGASQNSL